MRFEVTYRDGVFHFVVQSIDSNDPYHETFEIIDINEAKDTVWDLIDEISVEQGCLFEEFDEGNSEE